MLAALAARFPPFLLPLIFINLTGHMALSGGRLTGSLFVLKSGLAESLVGLFMASFSVIPAITALSVGRWVDRAGAGRVMRVGIALVLLGSWLPVVCLSLPTVLVMAVTIGCGFNMLSIAAQHTVGHLVRDAASSQRLANFSWFALGHSASSTLGPFLAGVLIDTLGFRAAFLALALVTCVAATLIITRTVGLPRAKPRVDSASANGQATRTPGVLDLLAGAELRRIYWVNTMTSSAWDLFIVVLPILGYRLGYSASVIGTVFSLFALGTFAARAATPWLSRQVNEWQILRVATSVNVLVFFLLPWASAAWALMLLGLVFGSAVGMSQPNMLSLLHSAAPSGRGGEAVGLRSVLSNSCSVLVPLGFGVALVPVGISALLLMGGALFASAIVVAHHGAKARHR